MGLGVWWLMPSTWPRSRAGGWLLALVGGGLLASQAARGDGAAGGVDSVLDFRARRALVCRADDHQPQAGVRGAVVRAGDVQHVRIVPAAVGAVSGGGDDHRLRRGDHRDVRVRDHARAAGRGDGLRPAGAAAVVGDDRGVRVARGADVHDQDLGRPPAPSPMRPRRGRRSRSTSSAGPPRTSRSARCTAWAARCSATICSRSSWPARCCWSRRSGRLRSRRGGPRGRCDARTWKSSDIWPSERCCSCSGRWASSRAAT